jgi:hypothetical protein
LQSFFAEGEHGAWWASHLHNAIAIRRKKWWEKPNEEETHIYIAKSQLKKECQPFLALHKKTAVFTVISDDRSHLHHYWTLFPT